MPKGTKQLLQGTMFNARLCTLIVYTGRVRLAWRGIGSINKLDTILALKYGNSSKPKPLPDLY